MQEETKKQIIMLKKQGKSLIEISNLTNVPYGTVRNVIYTSCPETVRAYEPFSEERQKEIAEDYYANNLTDKQVREKYHVDGRYMQKIRRKYGTYDKRRKENKK